MNDNILSFTREGLPTRSTATPRSVSFLRNPVYGHVALGAYQYLAFAVERLVDGFHKGGGLARSRRAVHDHHVFGAQHFVDGSFLRGVQPRETYRLEGEMSGLRRAVKKCRAVRPSVRAVRRSPGPGLRTSGGR